MATYASLDTVRSGVSLLAGLLRETDAQSMKPNGKISHKEVQSFIDAYGDGAELDRAMHAVRKYAAERLGGDARRAPNPKQVNSALGVGMRQIARAGSRGNLSEAAFEKLAPTWQKIVDFALRYEGYSVADLTQPSE